MTGEAFIGFSIQERIFGQGLQQFFQKYSQEEDLVPESVPGDERKGPERWFSKAMHTLTM